MIKSWGEDIDFKPYIVPVDIKDFVNHLDWKIAPTSTERADGHQLIRGKSFDVTDDITRYKAAGIEFFGPQMAETTSSSIWDFYSGAEINWKELENNCDANRDLYIKVKSRIIEIIKNTMLKSKRILIHWLKPIMPVLMICMKIVILHL